MDRSALGCVLRAHCQKSLQEDENLSKNESTEESPAANSRRYETGLVVLLFLTWGTVFLDRMSLVYLAPFIVPQLHLSHAQVGLLTSVLALAWAASSLIFGAISDRVGRRPILIPTVFIFSVLSWVSGITQRFGQLLLVRTLMGAAEGPTWSTITATIEESSAPEHRGRNVGIVVSAAALVGHALAPVLTTQVAAHFGWRVAFFVAGVPGIILGVFLWRYVREPKSSFRQAGGNATPSHQKVNVSDYLSLFRHRNIWLCCVASAGFMTWLWVMHAFAPLYITEVSKHSATFAGFVLGASGLGEFLWGWIFPWLSDRWGRKPVLLYVALVSALVPLTYQMPFLISHPWLMGLAGFIANGGQGMAALVLVLIPTESVSPRFAGTAIGLSTLVGEIFGGTLAPAISGSIADRHGLAAPLWIAATGAILVFASGLLMRETAPRKLAAAR
ncbi:MAG TPA: MFS transporter [Candidatus Angelobacter sp.]|nr:MFS transporter [Candidatus Angelobacter sp.]